MKIRFVGLVAHVTIDLGQNTERQRAALVAADGHTSTLSVRRASVINDGGIGDTFGGSTCFPLTGRVTFPDFGTGAASRLLVDEMPSLTRVTNGTTATLSSQLEQPVPDPAVFRAVLYMPPGGRLAPEDYFEREVDFNGAPHGPLPRTMIYLLATTTPIRIDIAGTLIELSNDAELLVANVCPTTTGNHFQNYRLVFDPPATVVYDPDDSAGRPCHFGTPALPMPGCAHGSNIQVDCSNSNFP